MQENFVLPEIDPRFDPLSTLDNEVGDNKYAKDNKLFVQFYTKPVMHPLKSTEAGRPIFDEVDYIRIRVPGSQLTCIDTPVTDANYLQRFGDKYRAWKAGQKDVMQGTPIESFPFMLSKVALIAELKAMGILTVEQLSTLDDGYAMKLMGGMELRKRAKEWIDSTSGTDAQLASLAAENDQMKAQMTAMMEQMKLLQEAGNPPAPMPDFLTGSIPAAPLKKPRKSKSDTEE